MEPSGTSPPSCHYPHHSHHHQPPFPPSSATVSNVPNPPPTNGIASTSQMLYTHAVPSSAMSSPTEVAKKKRGRPRKYATPEQAAEARRLALAASASANPARKKVASGGVGSASFAYSSSKKSHLAALGHAGQCFTPHVINVAAGEDVNQKIMLFLQQSSRELCILSASGSVSNASLRQPATSGGSITYEGRFDILSLSGSFVRTEPGGRAGGMSVCLSSASGQIVGGGVSGPLTAAGPIQVIVGTFAMGKNDLTGGMRSSDVSGSMSSSPGSASGYQATIEFSQQNIVGSPLMVQPRDMNMTASQPTDWTGSAGLDLHQSPENGNYEQYSE